MLRYGHDGQFDLETRVTPFFAPDCNRSAVIPDDAETNREAETSTAGVAARGEERIENPGDHLAVNSGAVIVKLEAHKRRLIAPADDLLHWASRDTKYF